MRHVFKAAVLRSALRNIVHWLRLPEARYYLPSASRPLFRPYRTDEFRRIYEEITPYTLASPDRCHILVSCARQALAIPGDFIECGVYRGGTAMLLQRGIEGSRDRKLLLFDTFEGMPENRAAGDSDPPGEVGDHSYEEGIEPPRQGLRFQGLISPTVLGAPKHPI